VQFNATDASPAASRFRANIHLGPAKRVQQWSCAALQVAGAQTSPRHLARATRTSSGTLGSRYTLCSCANASPSNGALPSLMISATAPALRGSRVFLRTARPPRGLPPGFGDTPGFHIVSRLGKVTTGTSTEPQCHLKPDRQYHGQQQSTYPSFWARAADGLVARPATTTAMGKYRPRPAVPHKSWSYSLLFICRAQMRNRGVLNRPQPNELFGSMGLLLQPCRNARLLGAILYVSMPGV
jgi:hypothetical protein